LLHGFQSAFQSLGINHPAYTPIIKQLGMGFSVIVSILFAAMPLAMHFHIIE
jgi:succinate dehydrogenase / fumarate reductase cytochrome b subunit